MQARLNISDVRTEDPFVAPGDVLQDATGETCHKVENFRTPTDRFEAIADVNVLRGDGYDDPLALGTIYEMLRDGWTVIWLPEEGDCLFHHSSHIEGVQEEVYQIAEICKTDPPEGHAVPPRGTTELSCITGRWNANIEVDTIRLHQVVNERSRRYGRGEPDRLEPLLDYEVKLTDTSSNADG